MTVALLHDLGDPVGGGGWRAAAPPDWVIPDLPGHGSAPATRTGHYDPMSVVAIARWTLAHRRADAGHRPGREVPGADLHGRARLAGEAGEGQLVRGVRDHAVVGGRQHASGGEGREGQGEDRESGHTATGVPPAAV